MTRLLTLAWVTCLVAALWLAALTPRASHYDLSLSTAYPPLFWVLTVSASVCAAAIPFLLAARRTRSPWWASGLFGVMATNVLILSLPVFRGYAAGDRVDAMLHMGHTHDILAAGTLGASDFYPAMHLLEAALQSIGGLSPPTALIVLNLTFSVLWTLGIVLLAERLAGSGFAGYLAVAFSAPFSLLVYQSYTLPNVLSAILVPVLFALLLRKSLVSEGNRVMTTLAALSLGLTLVVFHPVTSVYAIAELSAFGGAALVYSHVGSRRFWRVAPTKEDIHLVRFGRMASLMGVCLLAWSLSFSIIDKNVATVVRFLLGQRDRGSAADETAALVARAHAHMPLPTLARILWNSFGLPALVVTVVFLFAAVLVHRSARARRLPPRMHFSFIVAYLTTCVIAVGTLSVNSPERYPVRLLRMLVILGLCGLAWWCWEAIFSGQDGHWPRLGVRVRRLAIGALGGLLVYMITLGQLNVYASPRNAQPNEEVTSGEMSGMAWLIHNRSPSYLQASILPNYTSPFQSYLLGYDGARSAGPDWWRDDLWLPTHFYARQWQDCIANMAPGTTTYLALSEAGRIAPLRFPPSIRNAAHVYTQRDWQILASDPSANRIYDNGGFEVWVVNKGRDVCR